MMKTTRLLLNGNMFSLIFAMQLLLLVLSVIGTCTLDWPMLSVSLFNKSATR